MFYKTWRNFCLPCQFVFRNRFHANFTLPPFRLLSSLFTSPTLPCLKIHAHGPLFNRAYGDGAEAVGAGRLAGAATDAVKNRDLGHLQSVLAVEQKDGALWTGFYAEVTGGVLPDNPAFLFVERRLADF
jgi:hypothetical protein